MYQNILHLAKIVQERQADMRREAWAAKRAAEADQRPAHSPRSGAPTRPAGRRTAGNWRLAAEN